MWMSRIQVGTFRQASKPENPSPVPTPQSTRSSEIRHAGEIFGSKPTDTILITAENKEEFISLAITLLVKKSRSNRQNFPLADRIALFTGK
jgi:hypothetical protein